MGVRFKRTNPGLYKSQRWRAVRQAARRRDDWACVQCGARGRVEVDHITPLRDGGAPFDLGNLQCLCPACHARKTRIEIGLGRPDPKREAWANLLRDMQRNPSNEPQEV
jgi:5-methylcytosine-specific restriction endonuclease McrA